MAIRRFMAFLWRGASSLPAQASRAARLHRSPPRRLLADAMAAAGARGQRARACALARVRAIRTEGEAARSAAVACAHARARAAQAFLLHAQRQRDAAAAIAMERLLQATDDAMYTILKVLYGESAPVIKTPALFEMIFYMELLIDKANRVNSLLAKVLKLVELYLKLDADQQAGLAALLMAPFAGLAALIGYMIPPDTVSSAPEPLCPFFGECGLSFEEYPVQDCLVEVVLLTATSGGLVLVYFGGLVICVFIDAANCLDITCQTVADMIKGKTPEEIRKTFNIKNDFTPEEGQAPHYLDLTCHTVSDMIKGKTPKETRKTFNIKNDFTPEEEQASHYLAIRGLVDLTCHTVTDMVKWKTPQETRKTFNIKDDFNLEEEEEVRKENQFAF